MLKHRIPTCERHLLKYGRYSALWQKQGYGRPATELPQSETLLRFTTDSGWNGVIDVVEWFGAVAPDLAARSSHAWNLPQLVALFAGSQQPLVADDLPEELRYQKIDSCALITQEEQPLPACFHLLSGERGNIWFCGMASLPEVNHDAVTVDSAPVPLMLNFRIGLSTLSYRRVKQLQPGDALIIQHQVSDLVIDNDKIGHFIHLEEGYMFEEADVNMGDQVEQAEQSELVARSEQTEQNEQSEPVTQSEESPTVNTHSIEQIPVKLDFIFQQKQITVGELAGVYQGALLTCDPQAEKSIIIRANGLTIATGQLVWFEERPAVEITRIHQEVNGGKR